MEGMYAYRSSNYMQKRMFEKRMFENKVSSIEFYDIDGILILA